MAGSDARQQEIMRAVSDHIVVVDRAGRISYLNHSSPGLTTEEMIGSNWLDWLDPADRPLAEEAIARTLATGNVATREFRAIGPERRLTRLHVRLSRAQADGVDEVVLVAHELTTRRVAEEGRRASQFLLNALINSPHDLAIFALDRNGCYTAFNDSHRQGMREVWNAGIAIGDNLFDLMTDAQLRALARRSFDRALAGESFSEVQFQASKGIYFDFLWSPIVSTEEGIEGVTVFIRDVTPKYQAQAALAESEARYRALVEASPESITVQCDGKIVYANPAAVAMFGAGSARELVGKPVAELLHPDFRDGGSSQAPGSADGGIDAPFTQMQFIRLDGSVIDVEARNTQVTFDGRPAIQGTATDITARKATERRLAQVTRLYAALLDCNQTIMRCTSEAELFRQVCRDAVIHGGVKMAWIGLVDDSGQVLRPVASFGDETHYLDDIHISLDPTDPTSAGPASTAVRESTASWCQDFLNHPSTVPWRDRAAVAGWRAAAALPLQCGGRTIGALVLYLTEENSFEPDIRALLLELAMDISFALDRFQADAARARAETALRFSEARYRELFESNPQPMWVFDMETLRFIAVNGAAIEHYGYSRDEFLSMTIREIRPGEDVELLDSYLSPELLDLDHAGVWRHRRKDGSIILADITTHGFVFEDRPARLVIAQDVTEQVRLEAALIKSEALSVSILDSVSTEIAVLDRDGVITATNQPWRQFAAENSGVPGEVCRGANIGADYFAACRDGAGYSSTSAAAACEGIRAVLDGRAPAFQMEYDCHSPTEQRWFSMNVTPLGADRQGVVVAHADITGRKRAEKAARVLSRGIEQNPASIVITDSAGDIEYVNPRFTLVTGYTQADVIGKNPRLLKSGTTAPDVYRQLWSTISSGGEWSGELCNRRKDGELIWERATISGVKADNGEIEHYIAVKEDITQHKRREAEHHALEAQLWQSQKMEAIGTLAGGIAHDFNNLIATILGNAELAREDVPSTNPQAIESLGEIRKAAARARSLVQQLLAFSRRSPVERKLTELPDIVEESLRLLRPIIPARMNLDVHCGADLPKVLADATQMQQVVLNLVTNAVQAMEDRAGHIRVSLDAVMIDDAVAATHPELHALHANRPGLAVRLVVSDDGPGMDAATQARIFEPFFTTKTVTKGTGLGLPVVHGIVSAHEGAIVVESAPGKGATFSIFLPATSLVAGAIEPAAPPPARAVATNPASSPRILYLDDDESLVFLVQRLLERRGFRICSFVDQHKALAALRADPASFDLLVTDYNMPGMSGLDVACAARAIRADLPVAVISGYIDEKLQAQASAFGVREVIFKANDVEQLCDAFARLAQTPEGPSQAI